VEPDTHRCQYNIAHAHAFWIIKATDTHSKYVILTVFSGNGGYANAPECYVYKYIACLVETIIMCFIPNILGLL
jgi:hypothetical protein